MPFSVRVKVDKNSMIYVKDNNFKLKLPLYGFDTGSVLVLRNLSALRAYVSSSHNASSIFTSATKRSIQ